MKMFRPLLSIAAILCCLLMYSCFPEHPRERDLRIKTFLWEEVQYTAVYLKHGLLKELKAFDRSIIFYYDENKELYKAEIVFHGAASPESVFEYIQGPYGITRITWTQASVIRSIVDFTYDADGAIVHILNAFEGSSDPYNQHSLKLTHMGGNVTMLVNSINDNPFTQLRTEEFDNKKNPFRMLATSVNNPSFFPVGYFVFFQVSDYNIPYINWLSKNNPSDLIYETVYEDGFIDVYPMTYTYAGNLVKKIEWGDPYGSSKIFEFEYGIY